MAEKLEAGFADERTEVRLARRSRSHSRLSLIATLICLSCWAITTVREVGSAPATPKNLKEIFVGRCEEYQEVINPAPFITEPKNCTYLYDLFVDAFAYRDPCDVPVERYDAFTSAAEHPMETKDKVMYWSGSVYPLVYEYTADMRRYVTIRDILAGYIIKNIESWCGQENDPGYNYTECPPYGSCIDQATPTYWKAISKNFAERIEGHVHVMLNGSSGTAFRNTSTFAQYELVYLDADRNPTLSVLLIHNIQPQNIQETCMNGSLIELRGQVEQKSMTYHCTDDPVEVRHFQCADYVNAEVCGHLMNPPQQ